MKTGEYGIREHALLFALLGEELNQHFGTEAGNALLEEVTKAYGRKRGQRMRTNAERMGYGDSLEAFFLVGEWQGKPGENKSQLLCNAAETVSEVTRCAWYDTWVKAELISSGSCYCRFIDQALCDGFDGSFSLQVEETLSGGCTRCVFRWDEAVNPDNIAVKKREQPESLLRPFSFHCSELNETVEEVLRRHGEHQAAEEITARALRKMEECVRNHFASSER